MTIDSALIRRALPRDCGEVGRLAVDLTTSIPFQPEAFRTNFPKVLRDPGATLLVADSDFGVVGYLLGHRHTAFWAGGEVWIVEELSVQAYYRRIGIGRALMSAFEEECRLHGGKLVALVTRRAPEFYRALGYEESAVHFRKII